MATVSGGDALRRKLEQISANLRKAMSVEVGIIDAGNYPDGGPPVAAVAIWNEFGTKNIPPRPFFRNAIKKNSAKWPGIIIASLKANGYDTEAALGTLGQEVQEEIQDSIRSNTPPPNKPGTIAGKATGLGTLQNTLDLLRSVTHVVK